MAEFKGTTGLNSTQAASLWLIISYTFGTADIVNNTTPVTITVKLHHGGLDIGSRVNGCTVWAGNASQTFSTAAIENYSTGTATLGSVTLTVPHNADGTLTAEIGASFNLNATYSGTYVSTFSGAQSVAFPTIPRASTVSATDANIGSVSSIYINAKSSAFSHGLRVDFGGLSYYLNGDGSIASSYVTFMERSIPFRLPDSFYAQIPDSPSGTVTLTLWTHTDADHYFDPTTTTFTATAAAALCAPTVSATCQDTNDKTLALTGNADALVRYASTASGSLSVAARNSASIKRITVAGTEVPVDATSYEIKNVMSNIVTVVATDSRGYSTSQTIEKTLVAYDQLTCNILRANRPVPSSNEAQIEVSGQYFAKSFGAEDNELDLEYKNPDGEWVKVTPTIDTEKNTYKATITVPGLDYRQAFNIDVWANDKLFIATNTAQIMAGIPTFYWTKEFFQLNVPLRMDGENFLSKVYPIGSIYMSLAPTNPADLFGGTWEAIGGRFLIGTGLNEANTKAWFGEDDFPAGAINIPAGDMGGETTHKLTVAETPEHGHTMLYGSASGAEGWGYQVTSPGARSGSTAEASSGTGQTGGGAAHNNMPPYLAVYMWKRTA